MPKNLAQTTQKIVQFCGVYVHKFVYNLSTNVASMHRLFWVVVPAYGKLAHYTQSSHPFSTKFYTHFLLKSPLLGSWFCPVSTTPTIRTILVKQTIFINKNGALKTCS